MWHLLSFLLTSMIFSGCSYQQYFILSNATNDTISVRYSLENPKEINALFTLPAEIYQANRDYFPDWEHQLPFKDLDITDNNVYIKLPPKSVLILGTIHNDKYDSKTKKTNGGKIFNFQQMTFETNGVAVVIDEANFHDYFLEEGGLYRYTIR